MRSLRLLQDDSDCCTRSSQDEDHQSTCVSEVLTKTAMSNADFQCQAAFDKAVGNTESRVAILGTHVGQLGSQARILKHTCKV